MIEFTKAYKTQDGQTFGDLKEAQAHELEELLAPFHKEEGMSTTDIAGWIVDNSDKVIDILTTNESSRPKARKINGGTKKRKPQPQVDPQAELCKT